MHHPALVKRVIGAELCLAVDAEVKGQINVPLGPVYVQLLLRVADRQQQGSSACRYSDLRVDPERHDDIAAAVVKVAEIREVHIVGDSHAVAALPELLYELAAVVEALSVEGHDGLGLVRTVHRQAIQHGCKLAALGMHRSED